jgi:hypothetical protein
MSHDRKNLPVTVRAEDLSDALHKELKNPNSDLYKTNKFYGDKTFNDSVDDIIDVFEIINKQTALQKSLGETIAECILMNDNETRNEAHLAIKEAVLHYLYEHPSLIKKLLINKSITNDELKTAIAAVFELHEQKKHPPLSKSISHAALTPTNTSNRHAFTGWGGMVKSSSTTHLAAREDTTNTLKPPAKPKPKK